MTSQLFFLAVLILCASISPSYGFYCCLYNNTADRSMEAVACTSIQCSKITGWTGPWKSTFTVNCLKCSFGNGDQIQLPEPQPIDIDKTPIGAPKIEHKSRHNNRNLEAANIVDERQNPIPCCLYSSPQYYYTQPIYTEAVNPEYKPFCDNTLYGCPNIGQWYVSSLYNECFFVTRGG